MLAQAGQTCASEVGAEMRRWRRSVVDALLRAVSVVLLVTASWWIYQRHERLVAPYLLLVAITLGLSFLPKPWYRLRVGWLLLAVVGAGLLNLAVHGLTPNSYTAFAAATVMATILIGWRWGIAVAGAITLALGVVAWLQAVEVLHPGRDWASMFDVTKPDVVLRTTSVFFFCALILVLAPAYLLRQAEALALQNARSLDRLNQEKAEAARRECAYRKAQELELLGRLTGTAAHDFGNAVASIRAGVAELARRPGPDETAEILADLSEAADEAASTVEQLRVFGPARSEAPSRVQLRALVERAGSALRRALPKTISVQLELEGDPVVRAAEGQLLRVITNLALNGRDAMRGRGTLTLRLRGGSGGAAATLDVVDTGEGMSDEVKRHLFEPFFTTKGDRGTGLGLASVRDIVEGFGGRLDVESAPARGSRFTVHFPAVPPQG
jgi:signal transduction histidine kinase